MKILLDHRLFRALPDHEVKTTMQLRWGALRNGLLLDEAEKEGFSVMLTADKNIKTQQRMKGRSIALIVLRAPDNRRKTHIPMMPDVIEILATIQPGEVMEACA
ncbi:MAG: hypothetical protein ABIU20_04240 [Blastocatellia bacterium]